MMKSISISIAAIIMITLSGCQHKETEVSVSNEDSIEYAEQAFPIVTLENADSLIIVAQKGYETESTPTTLTCTESEVCYIRNAVDSLTMVRYYKSSEGEKNNAAVMQEYKCWQVLEAALEDFRLTIILKYNEDDPWKFLYARQADKQLFQAHTKMLTSDLEQNENCVNRVDFKALNANVSSTKHKLTDVIAKYKSDAPTEYKILTPLIDKWLRARNSEVLPLPYYNKDKNTEIFINSLIDYLITIQDYV